MAKLNNSKRAEKPKVDPKEVQVDTTPVEATDTKTDEQVDTKPEADLEDDTEVTVATSNEDEDKSDGSAVQVDTAPVDTAKIPVSKKVRVKVLKDTKFHFGRELYLLKKGVAYSVPYPVKLHLNKMGVLAPM